MNYARKRLAQSAAETGGTLPLYKRSRCRVLLLLFLVIALGSCSHLKMGIFLLGSNPVADDPKSAERGKLAYLENCATCHGVDADGRGVRAAQLEVPPTNFRAAEFTKPLARIAARTSYGKGAAMPAFAGQLSPETIWDIATYLDRLRHGNSL